MDSFLSDHFNNLNPQPASATLEGLQPSLPDIQQINPQIVALPFNDLPSYNTHLNNPKPQPIQSPSNGMEPYDPHLRLDLLTNQALLSMVQAWQEVIYCGEERYTLEHPHFQNLMAELVKRDMVSVCWIWTVDIAEVDMALTRAMMEGLGGFIRSSAGESDICLWSKDSKPRHMLAIAVVLLNVHEEWLRSWSQISLTAQFSSFESGSTLSWSDDDINFRVSGLGRSSQRHCSPMMRMSIISIFAYRIRHHHYLTRPNSCPSRYEMIEFPWTAPGA